MENQVANLFRIKALGAIAAHLCGDAYGAQFEFMSPDRAAQVVDEWDGEMLPSRVWDTEAGRITDDGEMTLAALKVLMSGRFATYNVEALRWEYQQWLRSDPFDVGATTIRALTSGVPQEGASNGALMRCLPALMLKGVPVNPEGLIDAAILDASITHREKATGLVSAIYLMLCRSLILGGDLRDSSVLTDDVIDGLHDSYRFGNDDRHLLEVLAASESQDPTFYPDGGCLKALAWAVRAVSVAREFHEAGEYPGECHRKAIMHVARTGGDTDTHCAIAAGMLACAGFRSPDDWFNAVLDCRSHRQGYDPRVVIRAEFLNQLVSIPWSDELFEKLRGV